MLTSCVFCFRSKFFISHRGQDREQSMNTDTVWTRNECIDRSKEMGGELCLEASVPMSTSHNAPLFPFTGPMSFELFVVKRDTFDKFHMEFTLASVMV